MKKNIKKILSMGLTVSMIAALMLGCGGDKSTGGDAKEGGSSSDGGKETTLVMSCWDDYQAKTMKKLGEAYNKENPNVKLDVQVSTWTEYWTKLEASVTGGEAADIFWVNVLHVGEYVDAGILVDLTDVGKKLDVNANYPEALVGAYTVDDKLYAVPKDFDTNAIFYNKTVFDKAGVAYPTDDMTFEDYVAKAKELKAAGLDEGVYPTAINRNSGQTTYYATINANGGYTLNDDATKPGWSLPETIAGIQPWVDMVMEGLSPNLQQMTDTTPDAMFSAGKLAMYHSGNYMIPEYESTMDLANIGIAALPTWKGQKSDIINGLGYAVNSQSKNQEEALKFVEWLGGAEAMEIQGKDGVVISARNDAQQYYLETYPDMNLKVFLDNLDTKKVFDHCKVTSELSTVEKTYLVQVWEGTMTLEEATAKIDEEEQPILDKMNGK